MQVLKKQTDTIKTNQVFVLETKRSFSWSVWLLVM
jgi:hypothetical protein